MRTDFADDDSDDNLQEAFCRLWTHRYDIESQAQAEGMLTKTAKNLKIDSLRRQGRVRTVDIEESTNILDVNESSDFEQTYSEVDAIIRECIQERDREILHLRDRCGWEFKEIAERFGISESNARLILSRTRKTVREIYRKRNNKTYG